MQVTPLVNLVNLQGLAVSGYVFMGPGYWKQELSPLSGCVSAQQKNRLKSVFVTVFCFGGHKFSPELSQINVPILKQEKTFPVFALI